MEDSVIITGISGQDGSYLADYLLENAIYAQVHGIIRSKESNPKIDHLAPFVHQKYIHQLTKETYTSSC